MKRRFYTLIVCVVFTGAVSAQGNNGNTPADTTAQNDTRWKLDGNMLTSEKFIGTLNQKDLIFKANSIEGLRITPEKDLKIPGQIYIDLHRPLDPGGEKILTVDYNGQVKSMEKSGLASALYSMACLDGINPIWNNKPGILYTGANNCFASVGIGTDNPGAMLHVTADSYMGSLKIGDLTPTEYKLHIKTSNGEGMHIDAPNAINWDYVSRISVPDGTAKAIAVHNNSHGDAFQVLANGRIETYVTDRNYALVIHDHNDDDKKVFEVLNNGTAYAKEIIVTLAPFPDYVFNKDYHLMPIKELGSFIEENGHLPNMPSAEEVDKEGIGVGELEVKLVEKVEELTLYLLEMKEELELLKKENEALKAKVESK